MCSALRAGERDEVPLLVRSQLEQRVELPRSLAIRVRPARPPGLDDGSPALPPANSTHALHLYDISYIVVELSDELIIDPNDRSIACRLSACSRTRSLKLIQLR